MASCVSRREHVCSHYRWFNEPARSYSFYVFARFFVVRLIEGADTMCGVLAPPPNTMMKWPCAQF